MRQKWKSEGKRKNYKETKDKNAKKENMCYNVTCTKIGNILRKYLHRKAVFVKMKAGTMYFFRKGEAGCLH